MVTRLCRNPVYPLRKKSHWFINISLIPKAKGPVAQYWSSMELWCAICTKETSALAFWDKGQSWLKNGQKNRTYVRKNGVIFQARCVLEKGGMYSRMLGRRMDSRVAIKLRLHIFIGYVITCTIYPGYKYWYCSILLFLRPSWFLCVNNSGFAIYRCRVLCIYI